MKYILYAFACVLMFACKKNNAPVNTTLYGKWKLTETAFSSGGPMEKRPADPNHPVYIEFTINGEYVDNRSSGTPTTFVIDSNTVRFNARPNADTITYRYAIANGTLKLTPIQPMCIEGCYTKYINVK